MEQRGCVQVTESVSGAVPSVVTMGDGRQAAAVGRDRAVRFLDPVTGREAAVDCLLPLPVRALSAAPGGGFVVAFGPEVTVLRP